MAHIQGLTAPIFLNSAPTPQAPVGTAAQGVTANNTSVIDGTPIRIVVLCLAAAAGLAAFGAAGLRFSIGAST